MDDDFANSIRGGILRTKIMAPKLPGALVRRDGLIRQLAEVKRRPVILVTAPSGFGKTTVLSLWQEHLKAAGERVAWLTLDENDTDIRHILTYIGLAIESCRPDASAEMLSLLLPDTPCVSAERLAHSLVNGLAVSGEPLTLFLDDLHLSACADVEPILEFIVNQAHDTLNLVIGTRQTPDIGVARLRVRDLISEITEADLRFSSEESAKFFVRCGRGNLTQREIALLHDSTEGWAAGLQLAGISLCSGQKAADLAERLASPKGYVGLYLAEELLIHQPREIVDFLLCTSVVERLTPSLCDALTGRTDGAAMLERARALNLFISPYEQEPAWFRYHGLFRRLLLNRLRDQQPELLEQLHRRACDWLAGHGLPNEAVRHAVACGDGQRAAALVLDCSLTLLYQSDTAELLRLINQLPPALVVASPHLLIAQAWAYTLRNSLQMADAAVARLESELPGYSQPLRAEIGWRIGALRATITALCDDTVTAKALTASWRPRREPSSEWEDAVMSNVVGFALTDTNNFTAARHALHSGAPLRRRPYTQVYGDILQGLGLEMAGRLHEAANRFRAGLAHAIDNSSPRSAAVVLASTMLAGVQYEWNNLAETRSLLQFNLDLIEETAFSGAIIAGYVTLARLSGRNRVEETLELIGRLEAIGRGRPHGSRLIAAALGERARFHLSIGDQINAEAALRELCLLSAAGPPQGGPEQHVWEIAVITRARVDISRGRPGHAVAALQAAIRQTEDAGRYGRSVPMRSLLVLAHDAMEEKDGALGALWELLAIAGPHGFTRSLLDEGPAMADFLTYAGKTRTAGKTPQEQRRLTQLHAYLAQLAGQMAAPPAGADAEAAPPASILSTRETHVLSAVAAGMSNKEVARALTLTPETVKWHMKSILTKLQAGNRTQAVRRAHELGLRIGIPVPPG